MFEPPPDLGILLVDEGEISVETNPKDEGRTPNPKRRKRSITTIRIGIHGPTPKCFGCKEGTYNHAQTCRDRFNELIDTCEPSSKGKSLSSSAHVGQMPSKTVPAPPSSSPAHPAGGAVKVKRTLRSHLPHHQRVLREGAVRAKSTVERLMIGIVTVMGMSLLRQLIHHCLLQLGTQKILVTPTKLIRIRNLRLRELEQ